MVSVDTITHRANVDDAVGHRWGGVDGSSSSYNGFKLGMPIKIVDIQFAIIGAKIDQPIGDCRGRFDVRARRLAPVLMCRVLAEGVDVVVGRSDIDDAVSCGWRGGDWSSGDAGPIDFS